MDHIEQARRFSQEFGQADGNTPQVLMLNGILHALIGIAEELKESRKIVERWRS